jgi:catechol 2,3-dioxygenase-like lactoylglutathione lyase family enzyme
VLIIRLAAQPPRRRGPLSSNVRPHDRHTGLHSAPALLEAPLNLNTARVFVRDIAQAREFYANKLGLKVQAESLAHGYCVFSAGNCELVVEAVTADAPGDEQALVGRFTGLSFLVPSVHVAHQDLVAKGVVFTGPPERQFWGGTLATFRDPEGNEFQVVHRDAA